MALRPCLGCGALIASGSRCPACLSALSVGRQRTTPGRAGQAGFRKRVLRAYGKKCLYCGATPPVQQLQAHHVAAIADGGSDETSNGRPACTRCHARLSVAERAR